MIADIPILCHICEEPMRHPMVREDEYSCRCGRCSERVRKLPRRGRFRGTPKQRRLRATWAARWLHRHTCDNCGERAYRCVCIPF